MGKFIAINVYIKATTWHQWLSPAILASQEAEIRRIVV
jgi:hypothetical protein